MPNGYRPPDDSSDIISTGQYERIRRGEATLDQINPENFDAFTQRAVDDAGQ